MPTKIINVIYHLEMALIKSNTTLIPVIQQQLRYLRKTLARMAMTIALFQRCYGIVVMLHYSVYN